MSVLVYLDDDWKDGKVGICQCGWSPDHFKITARAHERWWHPRWRHGLPVPGFAADGDIAIVRGCDYGRGARVAFTLARMAQLDGHYRSLSFPVPRPFMETSPEWLETGVISYIAIAESRAVGYVAATPVVEGSRCKIIGNNLEMVSEFLCDPHPSIGLVFVARAWRRQGIATRLIERIAADADLNPGQLIWQPPLTQDGLALARHFRPDGVVYVG